VRLFRRVERRISALEAERLISHYWRARTEAAEAKLARTMPVVEAALAFHEASVLGLASLGDPPPALVFGKACRTYRGSDYR